MWVALAAPVVRPPSCSYGRSEGSPDEQGTYRDARAAYQYLVETRRVSAKDLVLFGESLGAAIAVQVALERPAGALIIESAFTSIPDMARSAYSTGNG